MKFDRFAKTVLFVDDEVQATKWFEITYRSEFRILCANSADEALRVMQMYGKDIAVLITDFRMPGRNGLELLKVVANAYPWTVKVLASAYADKDIVIEALNEQLVFRVLEKPLLNATVRRTVTDALEAFQGYVQQRDLLESSMGGVGESLGFLAHELSSPLSIIGTYLGIMIDQVNNGKDTVDEELLIAKTLPVMLAAQRNIRFSLNLVSSFTESSKLAFARDVQRPRISASNLVRMLINEAVLSTMQKQAIQLQTDKDFVLPNKQNLIYLCLSCLLQNALRELTSHPSPRIIISVGVDLVTARKDNQWIRLTDNGSGIPSDVLTHLLNTAVTTYEKNGGHGMGLMFCKKVMLSLGGNISIESQHKDRGFSPAQTGTSVTLHFQLSEE